MKLSEKRRQAIYVAVSNAVMDSRIKVRTIRHIANWRDDPIDSELSALGDRAAVAAIEAAEGKVKR